MTAKMEEIVSAAINKIVLKCEVKHNHSPSPIATSKVMQKVTLLPSPGPPNQAKPSPADQLQSALGFISNGNSEYSRGAYQNSLN
jgi:hypothetical protein